MRPAIRLLEDLCSALFDHEGFLRFVRRTRALSPSLCAPLLGSVLLPGCIFGINFPSANSGISIDGSTTASSSGSSYEGTAESTSEGSADPSAGTGTATGTGDGSTSAISATGGASSDASSTDPGSGGDAGTTEMPVVCPEDADCMPGSPRCRPSTCYRDRFLFVTSVTKIGVEIGGTAGADALCNELAVAAKLFSPEEAAKQPMRAWISQLGDDAMGPVKFGKGRYFLPRALDEKNTLDLDDPSLLVVETFEELLVPSLKRAINRDENGKEYPGGLVWTNTNLSGVAISKADAGTCNQWSAQCCMNCPCEGIVGKLGAMDGTWTALSEPNNTGICFDKNRLYCFESNWAAP